MKITAERSAAKPKYDLMASAVMERCREFYQDPENEKAFREWMTEREKQHGKAG